MLIVFCFQEQYRQDVSYGHCTSFSQFAYRKGFKTNGILNSKTAGCLNKLLLGVPFDTCDMLCQSIVA